MFILLKTHKTLWFFLPWLLFFALAVIFWPGILRSDSINQLQQSLNGGIFCDHHPPIMAWLWRLLYKIYHHYSVMLLWQLMLYAAAVFWFCHSFKKNWQKLFVVILALSPMALGYQAFILKDINFANSYLYVCGYLFFLSFNQNVLSNVQKTLLNIFALSILFYGTAVKYQAMFIAPVIILWWSHIHIKRYLLVRLLVGVFFSVALLFSVEKFNQMTSKPSQAWQYVKLYDLAAMSLLVQQDIIPAPFKKANYSIERLQKNFNPKRVDELAFSNDSPLQKNTSHSNLLMQSWRKAIIEHPVAYLSHRWRLFAHQLELTLYRNPKDISNPMPYDYIWFYSVLEKYHLVRLLNLFTSYKLYFIIQVLIALFYLRKILKKTPLAQNQWNIFYMNLSGLIIAFSLLIFSMAAEARYTYYSLLSCLFSLPLLLDFSSSTNKIRVD